MRMSYIAAFAAIVFVGLAGSATPSQAVINHPWCYDGTANASGVPICGYDSYQQCVANAAGQCERNPFMDWNDTKPARHVHHRQ